ncbi:alpha/beta fold hydrolase [Amycolatopsis sp. 195334CR]|uniref:alpha/beta fold hydrolase n=1 Tax=Amycolatopsis sp. 195334CR TaxID=2814588 RepID=UPI001A8C3824|nr:alpha/beta fold hydrolase [Amycolatopsis sp. 195334CR]MBN6034777.1 alpha/beta fold hydrolase [Amycolatopsis sp. 195334CR]
MRERITRSGDVELWTQAIGDAGAPALLLNAGDCQSSMDWPQNLVRLLAEAGHLVLRYDYRDTGRSTHREFPAAPYDFDDLARDAVAVLDAWDVDRAHALGFGMGSAISQLLALDHRERLFAMTLLGSCAMDVDFFGNWERALTGEPTLDGLPTPKRWFVEMAFNPTDISEVEFYRRLSGDELPFDEAELVRRLATARAHADPVEPVAEHPHGSIRQDWTTRAADLPGLTTPALVVEAPLDPIHPPPHARHLAEVLPDARLITIPGMGHHLATAIHQRLTDEVTAHTLASLDATAR